jgi:hypothetical protein
VLLTKYYYADQIKEIDVDGTSGRRRIYRILVRKPEGVTHLGRNRRIEEDNIKITL